MDITLENELKPCAHCGSAAKVFYNELGNKEYISRCAAALSCGARGSAFLTKAESVEAWNKRAHPPAQQLSKEWIEETAKRYDLQPSDEMTVICGSEIVEFARAIERALAKGAGKCTS